MNGGPAFPRVPVQWGNGDTVWGQEGMTLRDYFAAQELAKEHGTVACDPSGAYSRLWPSRPVMEGPSDQYARIAEHCYRMADAMLAARKKQGNRNDD